MTGNPCSCKADSTNKDIIITTFINLSCMQFDDDIPCLEKQSLHLLYELPKQLTHDELRPPAQSKPHLAFSPCTRPPITALI